jgi:hypothetical protein
MQEHAGEKAEDKEHTLDCAREPSQLIIDEPNPHEK